ncbi:ATP-dependent RNA helicase DDX1 [Paragonimus westermani]|uniref:ATP-dependent RNA helicase DDX1 n=1 Tax=Paragonimus westermani TaxID=34504 RepID=A0A5J4NKM5_9TREM|nr:ATP-dependent RNA helicase DDX1 [Paragonimus westermani]
MAIDANGLLCQSRDPGGWHGARATLGVKNTGRYYYEAAITDEGLCRVGWSTLRAAHDVGTDAESFGFGGTGKMSHRRQFDSYGESFGIGDVIGCFLDLENMSIYWSKNGKVFPKAYDVPGAMRSIGLFPSVCLKNAEIKFNFGDTAFSHTPPKGWLAVNAAEAGNVAVSTFTGSSSVSQFVPKPNAPLALIMELIVLQFSYIYSRYPFGHVKPSRELAEQTCDQIKKFKRYLKDPCPRELLIIGGANSKQQLDALHSGVSFCVKLCFLVLFHNLQLRGVILLGSHWPATNFENASVDIVVATPGRLDDLISTGTLSLSNCRFFILDECDGLLSAGYGDMITRLHGQIPKVTPDGGRLQMVVCSATLHSFEVKKLANKLMHFPVWIDLKGQDSVPETVHHVICLVDPHADQSWKQLMQQPHGHIHTDGVHMKDGCHVNNPSAETLSEAVKLLKGEYVIRAIQQQQMDRALIFCRTKLDCDNLEQYFVSKGGGKCNVFNCLTYPLCCSGCIIVIVFNFDGFYMKVLVEETRNSAAYAFTVIEIRLNGKPIFKNSRLTGHLHRVRLNPDNGDVRFLICTDVAARGIDIAGLPYGGYLFLKFETYWSVDSRASLVYSSVVRVGFTVVA